MSRAGRALLVVVAVVLLAACGGEPVLSIPAWTLQAHGVQKSLSLPAHFDRDVGDAAGTYVLRTHVALPPDMRGRRLALTIPYFVALASLRANGLDAPDVDGSPLERYRGNGPHRFLIQPQATADGSLELELTVDHTWTQSAWLDTVPRLTTDLRGDPAYVFVSMFNEASAAAALAMMLLVGLAYGLVFLADRRRSDYGWFVLASFSGASYSAYTLGLFQPVFGAGDENALGFLVTVSSVSAIMFTASMFGRRASRAWWLLVLGWMAMAVYAHGPFRGTRFLAPFPIVAMTLAGGYCSWLLMSAWRRGRPPLPAVLASLGWPIVCLLALDDFASWLSMGELYGGVRGASLGTMVIAVLQASALSAQLMASLRRSDTLNAELEARLESLRVLNDELRRQVSNRSQQLAETLATVGSLHLPVLALTPGDVVEGRYRVVRFLGSGGMAWVYQVERLTDGRRLALKLLHGKTTGSALSRLAREARLASELAHPNIVGVVDVDLTAEGVLFLVMEHVDGRSLEQYLDDDPAIAWSLTVLRQIAEGLEAVHARAIVHRDLKPANVLVEQLADGPVAKIADFGLSLLVAERVRASRPDSGGPGDLRTTRAGRVMGTPMYMAPELADDGAPIDPSIDMYAFGVMAYELLVGRPPFRDPLFVRRLHGRSLPPPPSIAAVRPRIDRTVAAVIDACLAMRPVDRPSASDAVRVLREAKLDADPSSVPSVRAL